MTPKTNSGDDEKVVSLREQINRIVFVSPKEVQQGLQEVARANGLVALGMSVAVGNVIYKWGVCDTTPALNDPASAIALFAHSPSLERADVSFQGLLGQLLDIAKAVWCSEYRNAHGGLNLKANNAEKVFKDAAQHLANKNNLDALAVIYLDLDNFKSVNDQCSHDVGDDALKQVYAELHAAMLDFGGLAFFDGGDEFLVLLPTNSRNTVARALFNIRNRIKELEFGDARIRIDITAGVVFRSLADICTQLPQIKTTCEDLTKAAGPMRPKKRGTITFESLARLNQDEYLSHRTFFQLGVALVRSRQHLQDAFYDERLNLISYQLEELLTTIESLASAHSVIEGILNWFNTSLKLDFDETPLLSRAGGELSSGAICIAVLHGVVRAGARHMWLNTTSNDSLNIRWDHAGSTAVFLDENRVWGRGDVAESEKLKFGPVPYFEHNSISPPRAVVGLQIGFDQNLVQSMGGVLPDDFFEEVVMVDARPISGGGLPDFWQVALAQIIATLGRVPGITKILIWGEAPESTEAFKYLKGEKEWQIDEFAALTGLPTQRLATIKAQLPQKLVLTPSLDQQIHHIYEAYLGFVATGTSLLPTPEGQPAILHRPMVTAEALAQNEGIVCTTAAHAYPIIIDTLRKAENVGLSKDDSDHEHRELLAFKLKLTKPSDGLIPLFHLGEKQQFENYASEVLLKPTGMLRSKLEADHQIDAFITHLSSYVANRKSGRSTRRACLIVPHHPATHTEPKPLGLISVWAKPRFSGQDIFLDFVYVWRTVEAFIGLPYSLYGSIRLAQDLLLRMPHSTPPVQLGHLTYIALSLHLGSDEFHMRVAKRIVDLASD